MYLDAVPKKCSPGVRNHTDTGTSQVRTSLGAQQGCGIPILESPRMGRLLNLKLEPPSITFLANIFVGEPSADIGITAFAGTCLHH